MVNVVGQTLSKAANLIKNNFVIYLDLRLQFWVNQSEKCKQQATKIGQNN